MKYFYLLIFLLFISPSSLFAQKNFTSQREYTFTCGNESIEFKELTNTGQQRMSCPIVTPCDDPAIRDGYIYDSSQPTKYVKTLVRILRETDGSNPAATVRDVAMQFHHLNLDFAPYGIQFVYQIDYIDDSSIRTVGTIPEQMAIMANHVTQGDQFCNIFVGSGPQSFGYFPWFPNGQSLYGIMINDIPQFYPGNNRSTLTHEMGHALGLYHTFVGYSELPCGSNCRENMTSTGDTVGDRCSDTPPQDINTGYSYVQTTDNCSGIPFNPISHDNFMSYADNKLLFTPQQIARMHCVLESHPDRIGWLDDSSPEPPYVYEDDFGHFFNENYGLSSLEDWIDIESIGVEVTGLGDDNVVGPYGLGFSLNFYGQNFNQIYVGSNGYIAFSPLQINTLSSLFPSIPTPDTNNGFFAPFLADLNFSGVGNNAQVFVHSNQSDRLVVTFKNVPFYNPNGQFSGSNTFQMIVENIDQTNETEITYNYLDMDDYYPPNLHLSAKPSTIGIEAPSGTDGIEVNNYRIPIDNSVIRITNQSLSTDDFKLNKSFLLFPNPASKHITLKLENTFIGNESIDIEVFNVLGQKVSSVKGLNTNQLINDGLVLNSTEHGFDSSGLYFLKLSLNRTSTVKSFIIQ